MNQTIDISIIIVNYNTKELTESCINSVLKSDFSGLTKEIIVVDNASHDNSFEVLRRKYPSLIFIQNTQNFGFAKANNIGIKASHGKYILLLNSDTEVYPKTLQKMIRFMDSHPKAGASTCKLLLSDGSMDPACHRGFPTPWNAISYYSKLEKLFPKTRLFGGYHQGYKDMTVSHEVDSISGAFFLVRREVIKHIGMLDEAYFMYAEDIDFAYRIKESGWQIWFNPEGQALHRKKQSGREHEDRDRKKRSYKSFLLCNKLFYSKHYEKKYNLIITFLVYAFYDLQLWLLEKFGIMV